MSREVVIVDAVRTAFGRMGGTIRDIPMAKLSSIAIKGLVEKTKILEKGKVDTVMLGSAAHCSVAMNPARWASLDAGLPYETSASYVEMQCGSAIDSINHCAWKILAGEADVCIAGGSESYSQIPVKFSMSLPPYRLIPPMPLATTLSPVKEETIGMGLTAENLAKMYDIPREASDEFAYNSQMRAAKAMEAGYFDEEIIPITIPGTRKTPEIVFKVDEHPRAETTLEGLAKLRPAFSADGTVTAGNASGRNDGGAIPFGHPNGASGARVCMFAMRELIRRKGRYGFFSSCCGGGLGVATVIENLQR